MRMNAGLETAAARRRVGVSCIMGVGEHASQASQAQQLQRTESFDGGYGGPYNGRSRRGRLVSTGVDGRRMRCRAPLTRKSGGKTQLRTRSSLSQLNNL